MGLKILCHYLDGYTYNCYLYWSQQSLLIYINKESKLLLDIIDLQALIILFLYLLLTEKGK